MWPRGVFVVMQYGFNCDGSGISHLEKMSNARLFVEREFAYHVGHVIDKDGYGQ